MLFDTHCHLDFDDFKKDFSAVLDSARAKGVKFFLNVGCDLASSRRAVELAKLYADIFASIGLHPHFVDKVNEKIWDEFKSLTKEKIRAVGECGLDFYRNISLKEKQIEIFKKQIILAQDLNLPLILHVREAEKDAIDILKKHDVKKAVAHCFSGSKDYLEFCLKKNFFISFAGNITYPRAQSLRAAAKEIPLDNLLIETDCPFLTPQAARGKRCEPRHLVFVRDELARVKNETPQRIEEITTANALRCFGIGQGA